MGQLAACCSQWCFGIWKKTLRTQDFVWQWWTLYGSKIETFLSLFIPQTTICALSLHTLSCQCDSLTWSHHFFYGFIKQVPRIFIWLLCWQFIHFIFFPLLFKDLPKQEMLWVSETYCTSTWKEQLSDQLFITDRSLLLLKFSQYCTGISRVTFKKRFLYLNLSLLLFNTHL